MGFNQMVEAINRNLSRRQEMETQLAELAYNDQLTELPNRKSFHLRLEEAVSKSKRTESDTLWGLLFLDLDRFKDVNDTLGHPTGDKVLRAAGIRIRNLVRQSDMVFRQGGDDGID